MKTLPATKVLIVDGKGNIGGGLKISLELRGHETIVAHSVQEALALFCGFQPQAVLVNVPSLPGECAALLDKLQQFPHDAGLTSIAAEDADTLPPGEDQAHYDHRISLPVDLAELLTLLVARPIAKRAKRRFSRPR